MTFFAGDGPVELLVNFPVPCIKAAVADHFIMLFRDMPDEAFNEIHDRESLLYILFIFMAVVMEGDKVSVIAVDPGGGNDGAAQVTADIFYDNGGITLIGFGIHIKTVFMFFVA